MSPARRVSTACAILLLAGTIGAARAAPMVGLLYEAVRGPVRFFVFGSSHQGYSGFYPWNPRIGEALGQATAFYLEAAHAPDGAQRTWAANRLPDDQRLADILTPEQRRRLREVLENTLELTQAEIAELQGYHPHFVAQVIEAMALQMPRAMVGVRSLDAAMLDVVRRRGIPEREIEGHQAMAAAFHAMRREASVRLLERAVEDAQCQPCRLRAREFVRRQMDLIAQGRAEDVFENGRGFRAGDPLLLEAYDAIVPGRNPGMVERMEREASEHPGPLFFAPGAAHLGGPAGILRLLRERGYTLTHLK